MPVGAVLPLAMRLRWPLIDVALWCGATLAAVLLRFDFELGHLRMGVINFLAVAIVCHLALGFSVGPYAIGHANASIEEAVDLTRVVAISCFSAFLINLVTNPLWVPRSVPLITGISALLAMFGARFIVRLRSTQTAVAKDNRRVLIFGAGQGGRQLIRSLVRDPNSNLVPIGILDDDSRKRRWKIDGVKVLGTRNDLSRVAHETNAEILAIAIPSADSALLRELRDLADDNRLDLRVLPRTRDLLGRPGANDLRSLDLADLLGRGEVELDATAISGTIAGKTVLVTGAGGSIGSELCRQISRFGPKRLIMLDRDESALHATQISLTGRALLDGEDTVLADIRDLDRVQEVMNWVRPEVVFHAAALKHLPLLERYPEEAWKTNVLGSLNVLDAARITGVRHFVNISTDKAANPTSILGHSKRLTERLTAHMAANSSGSYVSVRFGNVLGSRGSVVTAFTQQIQRGGPVTVTHPDVERYFMLIPEACQLVLESAAIGTDGHVMVLNMGQPAKIVDVARTLIELSGHRDIDIVYTGLRPGEKLSEQLFQDGDDIKQSAHPLVTHVSVPPIEPELIRSRQFDSPDQAAQWMRDQDELSKRQSLRHDLGA